ncbi:hypothetical protein CCB80_06520 [Armatimonadetes bacterium Uphvl-Ar1]|nr:hypothetical protein CCB80_06520 [Armatimonadetes bacterium Uphvl-Ar1]
MSIAHRAFIGALLGAILALFIHPLSRPWFQYGLYRFEPSLTAAKSPSLAKTLTSLPPPFNDQNVSLYVQVAAEKLSDGESLDPADTLLLIELCRTAAEKDPTNAFWRQSEALFQQAIGNEEAALVAWQRAANRSSWTDYQSLQLKEFIAQFKAESRITMAWHYAAAASRRSSDLPRMVSSLGTGYILSDQSLDSRRTAFLNGNLIRDNARSKVSASHGYNLTEFAATGPYPIPGTRRERTFNRAEFPTEIIQVGDPDRAKVIANGLRKNEAYQALVFTRDTKKPLQRLTGQSILTSSLPGSLLITAVIFLALHALLCVCPCAKFPRLAPSLPAILGLVAGSTLYVLTQQPLLSLWILLILAIFSVRPPLELLATPPRIQPSTQIIGSILVVMIGISVTCYAIVNAPPMTSLRESLIDGWWTYPEESMGASILFFAGLLAILAQYSAYRQQRPAGRFLILLTRHAAKHAALASLLCSIILTPFCIYWDSKIQPDLMNIALNETAYYLNR